MIKFIPVVLEIKSKIYNRQADRQTDGRLQSVIRQAHLKRSLRMLVGKVRGSKIVLCIFVHDKCFDKYNVLKMLFQQPLISIKGSIISIHIFINSVSQKIQQVILSKGRDLLQCFVRNLDFYFKSRNT